MTEVTPDDKIARLVHLVLEAVDQRLEGLRHELQQLHHRLGEVEKSVTRVPSGKTTTASAPDPRVDRLTDEIRAIRSQLETLAARPQPVAPVAPSVPAPSIAPIASGSAASPVDTALPTLQPLLPAASAPPLTAMTTGEHPELIDLDRLNDLLTAKLGQLNLPRPN